MVCQLLTKHNRAKRQMTDERVRVSVCVSVCVYTSLKFEAVP